MPLSGSQRRYLRGLGHHLKPIVNVGHQGVTEGVAKALGAALEDHELVKVRLAEAVEDRPEAAGALATATGSECAQIMGRTVLLYRRREKDPKIEMPAPRPSKPAKGPKGAKAAKGAAAVTTDDDSDDEDAPAAEVDSEDE